VQKKNPKDTFEAWLVGELLLVALLGSATALFLTNPILRNTYELPEGRLVLDTAVVLAATIVAILAGVRFSVEGRLLDFLLAAGFLVAGIGTLAFSVAPVLGGGVPNQIADTLSAREVEVLLLLDDHLSTDDIAKRLFISEHTVRSHVKSLLRKLGVSSRRDALEQLAIARR